MTKSGLLVIISGPSGAGKTTIARRVESELGGVLSVSMTSRPPAHGDQPGIDYIFVDADEFKRRRDADEMLEWAEVFGNYYGTPRQPALDAMAAGDLYILEIDVAGAIQVKDKMPEAFSVFILPPSEEELLARLRGRQREDEDVIQRRFAQAQLEIAHARKCKVYDHFIVNDDLDTAIDKVIQLVTTERERTR